METGANVQTDGAGSPAAGLYEGNVVHVVVPYVNVSVGRAGIVDGNRSLVGVVLNHNNPHAEEVRKRPHLVLKPPDAGNLEGLMIMDLMEQTLALWTLAEGLGGWMFRLVGWLVGW